ncbi:MAG: hypothetical protein IIT36_02575 [Aeriscardovia sp.]|nr:hypothetical protein [Aeriscardovia sp.]
MVYQLFLSCPAGKSPGRGPQCYAVGAHRFLDVMRNHDDDYAAMLSSMSYSTY